MKIKLHHKYSIKQHYLEYILILIFAVSSYQKYFGIDFLDDLLLVIFAGLIAITVIHKSLVKKNVAFGFFSLMILLPFAWLEDGLVDYFIFFKVVLLLYTGFLVTLGVEGRRYFSRLAIVLSIPNIIQGVYQYVFTSVLHGYIPGKYELGKGFRLMGFTGHPIPYSVLLLGLLIFTIFYGRKKEKILIPLLVFLIINTWSSFSIAITYIVLVMFIYSYLSRNSMLKKILEKYAVFFSILIIVSGGIVLFFIMSKEEVAIRSVSAIGTIKQLSIKNLFFGNGFGTFTSIGYKESYIFKVLYDTGLFGVYIVFFAIYKALQNMYNRKNWVGFIFIIIFSLNMFINDGYMIPFIFLIPLVCCDERLG